MTISTDTQQNDSRRTDTNSKTDRLFDICDGICEFECPDWDTVCALCD